jgi:hypothetical protein
LERLDEGSGFDSPTGGRLIFSFGVGLGNPVWWVAFFTKLYFNFFHINNSIMLSQLEIDGHVSAYHDDIAEIKSYLTKNPDDRDDIWWSIFCQYKTVSFRVRDDEDQIVYTYKSRRLSYDMRIRKTSEEGLVPRKRSIECDIISDGFNVYRDGFAGLCAQTFHYTPFSDLVLESAKGIAP